MLTFIQSFRRSTNVGISALALASVAASGCDDSRSITAPNVVAIESQASLVGDSTPSTIGIKLTDLFGQPLANVAVEVLNDRGEVKATGATDETGAFSRGVPNGRYRISATADEQAGTALPLPMPSLFKVTSGVVLLMDTTRIFDLSLKPVPAQQNTPPRAPISRVSVQVLDPMGRPVAGARVFAVASGGGFTIEQGFTGISQYPNNSANPPMTAHHGGVGLLLFGSNVPYTFSAQAPKLMMSVNQTAVVGDGAAITVRMIYDAVNDVPAANAGGPYTIDEGHPVTLDGTASREYDGEALTYLWEVNGQSYSGARVPVSLLDNGTYAVKLTVTDQSNNSNSATTTVTVRNVIPSVNSLSDATIFAGELYAANGSFTDPGADAWTGSITCGSLGQAAFPVFTRSFFARCSTFPAAGWNRVVVSISDDDGGSDSDTAMVYVRTRIEGVQDLMHQVVGFRASGAISPPFADNLMGDLQQAAAALWAGNVPVGVSKIESFSNKVASYMQYSPFSPQIPAAVGNQLRTYAGRVSRATM